MAVSQPDPATVLSELENADRLLVQQVFRPIANEYRISVPSSGATEEGRPLLFVKQKKMKIKEDIRFRVSEDDGAHLFMIKSKSVFEFRAATRCSTAAARRSERSRRPSAARSCAAIGTSATHRERSCSRLTRRAR